MANVIEFKILGKEDVSKTFGSVNTALTKTQLAAARAAAALTVAATAVAAVTAAVAGSVVGAYKFTTQYALAEDTVGKFAARLGTTADTLSMLHAAAKFGGQSIEQMNMSIQRFNRRIGDSLSGMGEASSKLKVLGLDAKALAELPLEERMYELADALARVENPTQRLSAAVGLLDSEGAGFLQTIKNGSQSLKDVAKDLEFLGGVISPQAAANAAVYNDQMERMRLAFSSTGRAIGDVLMPYLANLSRMLANFVATHRVQIAEFFEGVIMWGVRTFLHLRNTFRVIKAIFTGTFDWGQLLINSALQFQDYFGELIRLARLRLQQFSEVFILAFKLIWRSFAELGKWAWDNLKELFYKGNFSGFDELGENLKKTFKDALDETSQNLWKFEYEIRDIPKSVNANFIKPVVEGLTNVDEEAKRVAASLRLVGEASKEIGGSVVIPDRPEDEQDTKDNGDRSLENQRQAYATFYDAIAGYAESFRDRVGNAYAQLGAETFSLLMNTANAAGQAFASVVTGSQSLGNALSNLFKQVLAQGIAMLVRIGVQRLILKAINLAAVETESARNIAAGLKAVYVNSFASAAAIPFTGWVIAPGVAEANLALAIGGLAKAEGASLAGAAHGGLEYVPKEGTYLLDKGERVLSPNQNKEFTKVVTSLKSFSKERVLSPNQNKEFTKVVTSLKSFHNGVEYVPNEGAYSLAKGERVFSAAQNERLTEILQQSNANPTTVVINKIEVLPNATNAKAFLDMDSRDVERIVADKLYDAFEKLSSQGIKMRGVY
jgi:hypothetical protein